MLGTKVPRRVAVSGFRAGRDRVRYLGAELSAPLTGKPGVAGTGTSQDSSW